MKIFNAAIAAKLSEINFNKRIKAEKKNQRRLIIEGINLKTNAGKRYMELWSTVFYEDVLDEFRKLNYKIEVDIRPDAVINRITKFTW